MPNHEKTVYYSNSATRIVKGEKSLVAMLCEVGFSPDEIGICVSESSAQKLEKDYNGLKENCKKSKESILKNQVLDDQCRILLTTSCLKEGINIENDNIRIAFCESHILSEIQQFAGRIRKGLDVLYIISDAMQHTVSDEELRKYYLELHYACHSGKKAANDYIEDALKNTQSGLFMDDTFYDRGLIDIAELYQGEYSLATMGGSLVPMYINMIESTNQYLKFNHLTGKFDVYANRYIEQRRVNRILSKFIWINDIEQFANANSIEFLCKEAMYLLDEAEIIEYCEENRDVIWVDDDKTMIKHSLCYMMALAPDSPVKTINSSFNALRIPYQIENVATSRKGKNKRGVRIIENSN